MSNVWKLVPAKPTPKMIHAMDACNPAPFWKGDVYAAMLAAAPQVAQSEPEVAANNIDARFTHRLAIVLECMILNPTRFYDEACALIDEYKSAWEEVNPSPPTFMGEPVVHSERERAISNMQKYYSADGENFHLEVGEVFDLLDNEGELVAGRVYYEANCKRVTPGDLIRAHNVIDSIFDAMLDKVGDVAESYSYSSVGTEAENELQQLLEAWITKHANPSAFFRIVGKPRKLAVTQHDVNDLNRAEPKGTAP